MNNFRSSFVALRCTLHLLRALQLATSEVSPGSLPMKTRLVRCKNPAMNALQKHTLRCRSNRFRSSPLHVSLQARDASISPKRRPLPSRCLARFTGSR